MFNNLKHFSIPTRILTASVISPLLILIIWAGSQFDILFFTLPTALISGIGSWEINRIIKEYGVEPKFLLTIPISAAIVITGQFYSHLSIYYFSVVGLIALTLLVFMPNIIKISKFHVISKLLFPIFIPAGFLVFAPILMQSKLGAEKFVFMFLMVITFDTFALTVGKLIGKRKLIPSISPNKTWEGLLGGIIASFFLATFLLKYDQFTFVQSITPYYILVISIVVLGQLGDISISRIKRMSHLKDTSSILPGHGGILDRLDSILFNLLLMHYFLQ